MISAGDRGARRKRKAAERTQVSRRDRPQEFHHGEGHRISPAPRSRLAPTKILAAQLYVEFKSSFPDMRSLFVSYYDIITRGLLPRSDTTSRRKRGDEAIDRMPPSATGRFSSATTSIVAPFPDLRYRLV